MRGSDHDDIGEFVLLRKIGTCAPSRIRIGIPADASAGAFLGEVVCFMRACGYLVPDDAILDFVDEVTGQPMDDPLEGTLETNDEADE